MCACVWDGWGIAMGLQNYLFFLIYIYIYIYIKLVVLENTMCALTSIQIYINISRAYTGLWQLSENKKKIFFLFSPSFLPC
jgi:hypothetical protein